jgi:hypothetical protein
MKKPVPEGPALFILVAGAGWPSPLRGSVGLVAFIPMLRIGATRFDPAPSQAQLGRAKPNKKGPLFEGPLFVW